MAVVSHVAGSSITTDVETSWTARLVLVASVPYLILELQNAIPSSSAKKVLILIALIITVALLFGYILFQVYIHKNSLQQHDDMFKLKTYAQLYLHTHTHKPVFECR